MPAPVIFNKRGMSVNRLANNTQSTFHFTASFLCVARTASEWGSNSKNDEECALFRLVPRTLRHLEGKQSHSIPNAFKVARKMCSILLYIWTSYVLIM